MGCLSDFDQQNDYEKERQKEKELQQPFVDLFLELVKSRDNYPETVLVEKDHCGRPTYLSNESLRSYCPKCSGCVQLFIENKLVKIIKDQNKIYPVYSEESCLLHQDDNPAFSKLKQFNNPEVSTEVKTDDKGNYYFYVLGKKLYLSPLFTTFYKRNPFFSLAYFMSYACQCKSNEQSNKYPFFNSRIIKELNQFNIDNIDYPKYDVYKASNPLDGFEVQNVLIYYRCIKCHFEYHLYLPRLFYFFNYLKKSENPQKENENKI